MVNFIIALVLVAVVLLGSAVALPRVFQFRGTQVTTGDSPSGDNPPYVTNDDSGNVSTPKYTGNVTIGDAPFSIFSINPYDIPRYITEWGNSLLKQMGDFLTAQVRGMFPNASSVLGLIIIAIVAMVVLYVKMEWVTSNLRTILVILIIVLVVGLVLAMLGLLP